MPKGASTAPPHHQPYGGVAYDDLSASWSALRRWELARELSVQHAEPVIA